MVRVTRPLVLSTDDLLMAAKMLAPSHSEIFRTPGERPASATVWRLAT